MSFIQESCKLVKVFSRFLKTIWIVRSPYKEPYHVKFTETEYMYYNGNECQQKSNF